MHVTISNKRLRPVSKYSDEAGPHSRPRDIFHYGGKIDLWRWAPVPGDTPFLQHSAGSSTSGIASSDLSLLDVTKIVQILNVSGI